MKIEPTIKDAMPYEVATSILTSPKARLTNTMRKRCRDARAKEYTHSGPLERETHTLGAKEKGSGRDKHGRLRVVKMDLAPYEVKVIYSADEKLDKKLSALPLQRLERFMSRCAWARHDVQRKYVKLQAKADTLGNKDHAARRRIERAQEKLATLAGHFERLMDHTEDELKFRDQHNVKVIDPQALGRGNRCHGN